MEEVADDRHSYQLVEKQQDNDNDDDDDDDDNNDNSRRGHDVKVRSGSKLWKRKFVLVVLFVLCCLVVGVVAAALVSTTPASKTSSTKPWDSLRLGKKIFPYFYDLNLHVDMVRDTYRGSVAMHLSVVEPTEYIMFNKVELLVQEVSVTSTTMGSLEIAEEFYHTPNEVYVVRTRKPLTKGTNLTLIVTFNNSLSSDLSGLYKSEYKEGDVEKKLACTFFSPISARKAFPCFDEPLFKAEFRLTLTHSNKYKALSNMPVQSTRTTNGFLTTQFQSTIKMSTYIVAWLISEFESVHQPGSTKPVIRGWAQKDKLDDLRYALQATSKLLRFYEKYFGIPYQLTKLDSVALPNLAPAAMENWGAIFYRAPMLLYNGVSGTKENKQEAFNVIAHELVHQWFGNLVTMEYWTDAWLKEGFANNIAIIGGDEVDKSLALRETVLTELMLPAMDADSYSKPFGPISTNVNTPSDVRQVFNVITYSKGSCIVEIIRQLLGPVHFRAGLQKYLTAYSYKNAVQDDLWAALSDASGTNVKEVMDTWTLQSGYPVVTVSRINDTTLRISQQKFTLDPPGTKAPPSPFNYLWRIPIVLQNPATKSQIKFLLSSRSVLKTVPSNYTIVNPDHSLFYRVYYGKSMLDDIKRLLRQPHAKHFTAQDCTGLISDQFNFVAAGMTPLSSVLDILKYRDEEIDYFPWKQALHYTSYIHSLIESNQMRNSFGKFIKNLTAKTIFRTGWQKPQTANEGSLQILMITHACSNDPILKDQQKISEAKLLYRSYMNGTKISVRPSLVPVINDCAIAHGPDAYWDFLFRKYREERGGRKEDMLMSLTATTNPATINKLLNYSLHGGNVIETQDVPYVLEKIAEHSELGRRKCWDFIKQNWDFIIRTYGNELYLLGYMLEKVLGTFSTQADLDDIREFFKGKDLRSGSQGYAQAEFKIQAKIRWKEKHLGDLGRWLHSLRSK